jgi:hypothetical protein
MAAKAEAMEKTSISRPPTGVGNNSLESYVKMWQPHVIEDIA